MNSERHHIIKLNAQTMADTATAEAQCIAKNDEARCQQTSLKAQRPRQEPPTHVALMRVFLKA
jgi:hypothetical protein